MCEWMYVGSMEFSDEEDFVLTQTPVKEYSETQSASYGDDLVDSNKDIVSLEAVPGPSFQVIGEDFFDATQPNVCDGVQIEDISSDEELESM